MSKVWYLYILKCEGNFLYTGISVDVKKRVLNHKNGKGARFTKIRTPLELVYIKKLGNVQEALKVEREIKKYSKQKKENIIENFQESVKNIEDEVIKDFLSVNKELILGSQE